MNRSFLKPNSLFASLAIVSLLGPSSCAQEPQRPTPQREVQEQAEQAPPLVILKHGDILGAPVASDGSEERVRLGGISELIVQAKTGKIRQAVIAVEGTAEERPARRLVEWSTVRFDKERGFSLAMTRAELGAMPAYEPRRMGEVDTSASGSERSEGFVEAAAARRAEAAVVHVSDLMRCEVYTKDGMLPGIANAWFEPASGELAFVDLALHDSDANDGTTCAIPWVAIRYVAPEGGMGPRLQVNMSSADLDTAPKVGGALDPKSLALQQSAFRDRVYSHFHVERPTFEPVRAEQRKDGEETPGGSKG